MKYLNQIKHGLSLYNSGRDYNKSRTKVVHVIIRLINVYLLLCTKKKMQLSNKPILTIGLVNKRGLFGPLTIT